MKWEYITAFSDTSGLFDRDLEPYGEAGWELITVVFNGRRSVAYFKRPK